LEEEIIRFRVCLRCGRELKNEESRKIGYGKVCLKKMQQQDKRRVKKLFGGKDGL